MNNPGALLRIDPVTGVSENVTSAPYGYNVGDIDTAGQYWSSRDGLDWYQTDLFPGSPTYGKVLGNGTADPFDISVADWVYVPVGGSYSYSVGVNSTSGGLSLIRFGMLSKKWERVANYPSVKTGTMGGIFGMNNGTGTLYASDNDNGKIWQFSIEGNREPFVVSDGPTGTGNDGARCVLNPYP